MSQRQVPQPVLYGVIAALGVVALFGGAFGFNSAAGRRGGFDEPSATTSSSPVPVVRDAVPLQQSSADLATAAEAEAAKAAAEKAKAEADAKQAAEDKAKADAEADAATPTGPQAYITPPPPDPAPTDNTAAPAAPGPRPPPEAPSLY